MKENHRLLTRNHASLNARGHLSHSPEKKNQGVILCTKVYMEKHKSQIKMFLCETEGIWQPQIFMTRSIYSQTKESDSW